MVFRSKEIQRPISIPFAINNLQLEDSSDENQVHQSVSPILMKKTSKTFFHQPIMNSKKMKATNKNKTTLSSINNIITSIAEIIPTSRRSSNDAEVKNKVSMPKTTWSKNNCTSATSICQSGRPRGKSQDEANRIVPKKLMVFGRGGTNSSRLNDNRTKTSIEQTEIKKQYSGSASENLSSKSTTPSKSLNNKTERKASSPIPTPKKMVRNRLSIVPQVVVTTVPDSPKEWDCNQTDRQRPSSSFQHYELSKLMESFMNAGSEPWNNSKLFSTPRRHSCGVCEDVEKHFDSKITPKFVSDDEYDLRCTDFGISDFLSSTTDFEKENEDDIVTMSSSDETENCFLNASPPHRFSDPDLGSIEPLAVTLGTILKTDKNSQQENNPVKVQESHTVNNDECKNYIKKSPLAPKAKPTNYRKPFLRQISLPSTAYSNILSSKNSKSTHSLQRLQSFDLNSKNCHSDEMRGPRILETGRSFDSTGSHSNEDGSDDNMHSLGRINLAAKTLIQEANRPTEGLLRRCFSITSNWDEGMINQDYSSDSLDLYWTEQGEPSSPSSYSVNYSSDNEDGLYVSDLERNAYFLRNRRMKQLVRQETMGNIAPPDYCI